MAANLKNLAGKKNVAQTTTVVITIVLLVFGIVLGIGGSVFAIMGVFDELGPNTAGDGLPLIVSGTVAIGFGGMIVGFAGVVITIAAKLLGSHQ